MSQCTYSDNIASIDQVLLRMYGNNVSFVDMINEDSYDEFYGSTIPPLYV